MESDWQKYKKLILHEITELRDDFTTLNLKIDNMDKSIIKEISLLKGRASVWGAVSGMLAGAVIATVVKLLLIK